MTPTQQIIEALGDCVHVEEVGTCTEVTLRVELDEMEDHDTNPAMLAYHLRRLAGDLERVHYVELGKSCARCASAGDCGGCS